MLDLYALQLLKLNYFPYCSSFIQRASLKTVLVQTQNNATFHKILFSYTPTLVVTPCFSTQSRWKQRYEQQRLLYVSTDTEMPGKL